MPGLLTRTIGRTAERVPGLRGVPILRLLALSEIALLARAHLTMLEPKERRRVLELFRTARGRMSNLSASERRELKALIAKAEPRVFAGAAVEKLSPVSVPGRLLYGSSSTRGKGKKPKR